MKIGNIELRAEGENWNAYYNMHPERFFLGSIRMTLIANRPERRQAFIDLMQGCMADLIKDTTGKDPNWITREIPEEGTA